MIYWNGCSFVQGMELLHPMEDGFPHLVSKHFNVKCRKQSKVGGSNERIFRTSTHYLATHNPTLAVFVWTTPNRFEYLAEGNLWRNAGWSSFGFDRRKLQINPEFSQIVKHPDMTRQHHLGLSNYGIYVRNIRYNLIQTLTFINAMKKYCKALDIPSLHYFVSKGQLTHALHTLDEKYYEATNIIWEEFSLNRQQWLELIPELKTEDFYTMCQRHKVAFGPKDHPLEDGQQLMADRIIKDIYDKELDKQIS